MNGLQLRLGAFGFVVLLVAVNILAGPGAGTALFGAAALVAAAVAALLPSSPAATVVLLTLAAQYACAADGAEAAVQIPAAVAEAAGLWLLHALFAVLTVVPAQRSADPALLRRARSRFGAPLVIALPAVAITVGLGTQSPVSLGLRITGALAAVTIVVVPLVLVRRRRWPR